LPSRSCVINHINDVSIITSPLIYLIFIHHE
jgi:hypothetical protein